MSHASTGVIELAVNPNAPPLFLTNAGLQLQAVSGVAGKQTGTLTLVSAPAAATSYSVTTSTLTGGNWLSVAPSSGNLGAGASAAIAVQADPSGLAPGNYYGGLTIASSGGATQTFEVGFTVLPSATVAAPLLSPSGLIFTAAAGSNPAPQQIRISNPGAQTLTISAQPSFGGLASWFTPTASASVATNAAPLTETVAVNTSGLTAGAYLATLNFKVAETGVTYPIEVLLIVQPAAGTTCTPTQLHPVFTNLPNGFNVTGGMPVAFNVRITDDCGNPLTAGSALAYFPNGDPAIPLLPLGGGLWTGTWQAQAGAGGAATVGVMVSSGNGTLYGSAAVTGTLSANTAAPSMDSGGVVNAASLANQAPLAISPGSFISIFGNNMADGSGGQNVLPYPPLSAGTQILLGGEPMPLEYVGAGQINAIVPYDSQINASTPLVVVRDGLNSRPQNVLVGPAQPAVFTQNQSGTGAGAIVVVKPDGTQFLNTPASPATSGDTLVIYCSGLGAVSPSLAAGSAASAATLSRTVNPVTVSVGGQTLQPLFAGLTPGTPACIK